MNTLSKLMLAGLTALPLTLSLLGCEDDGDDTAATGGRAGDDDDDDNGGKASGGKSGGNHGDDSGGRNTESGGGSGDDACVPYELDDCLASDGPASSVTESDSGAFSGGGEWVEGQWTGWGAANTDDCDLAALSVDDAEGISGDIADDTTLESGAYLLKGNVSVVSGGELTIEPCTVIYGESSPPSTLIVERGGKIFAVGTPDEPILFTSANGKKEPGQWGGVILLGSAKNFKGASVGIEGLPEEERYQYGGNDDDDSSGELEYVRIEYSGIELSEGNEINGLTLGSVGGGTKVSHVIVRTTLDDGFEWFGGTVDVDHLITDEAGDDLFDADQGYRGTMSYLFGRHLYPLSQDPNGFEMDSEKATGENPRTNITAENVTLCGDADGALAAFRLREHLKISIDNAMAGGFSYGVFESDGLDATITNSTLFDLGSEVGITQEGEADPVADDEIADIFLGGEGNEVCED